MVNTVVLPFIWLEKQICELIENIRITIYCFRFACICLFIQCCFDFTQCEWLFYAFKQLQLIHFKFWRMFDYLWPNFSHCFRIRIKNDDREASENVVLFSLVLDHFQTNFILVPNIWIFCWNNEMNKKKSLKKSK